MIHHAPYHILDPKQHLEKDQNPLNIKASINQWHNVHSLPYSDTLNTEMPSHPKILNLG